MFWGYDLLLKRIHGNEPSWFEKDGEFLEYLSDNWLINTNDASPRSLK
jgi:hypothetical protein